MFAGKLDLPGYVEDPRPWLRVNWIPPKWDWVDPFKDIKAEILAKDAGLKSRSSIIKAMGDDPEQVDQEIADERQREKTLGLDFTAKTPANGIGHNGGPPLDETSADDPDERRQPAAA